MEHYAGVQCYIDDKDLYSTMLHSKELQHSARQHYQQLLHYMLPSQATRDSAVISQTSPYVILFIKH